jgi:hypothetical protein
MPKEKKTSQKKRTISYYGKTTVNVTFNMYIKDPTTL